MVPPQSQLAVILGAELLYCISRADWQLCPNQRSGSEIRIYLLWHRSRSGAGQMGRRFALTRVDLTRRPQALGRLRLRFGLPAHLHVLCSIWAFLSHPKQNHKSGAADAVRFANSSTLPQSSEVIDWMPRPSSWHDTWELSLNLSQQPCPYPLFFDIALLSYIGQLSEF